MTEEHDKKIVTNLKKAHGQITHINAMIVDKRYCIDIAQQVNAAIGLLRQVNNFILESHLLSCGRHKLNSKDKKEREEFIRELIKTFNITSY